MRARALVALTIVWAIAAAAPASAQEGKKVLRMGWAQEPQTLCPVHRPGRGGLPRLVAQLRPARQLQPQGPRPDPRHRRELEDLARQEDRHLQAVRGAQVVRRHADHLEGRQVQPRDVRPEQPAVPELRREHQLGRRRRTRTDGDHQHQAARRADRRRAVRLHPARARVGQAVRQVPHGLVQAAAAARRQRPLRRQRDRPRPPDPDDAQPELPRREAGVRRGAVDQVRQRRRGRAGADAGRDRPRARGPAGDLRAPEEDARTSRRSARPRRRSRSSRSTSATRRTARTRSSTPAVQDVKVRQAIAYAVDRKRINAIASRGTAFEGHGLLPDYYKAFYSPPQEDYALDVDRRTSCSTRRAGSAPTTAACAPRAAPSCRSTCSCARSRRRTSRPRGSCAR